MLTPARFFRVIEDAPLVGIDLVITDAQQRMLFGKRQNAPAQGF